MVEVQTEFKKTDVGVVPTDWNVEAIKDIATVIRGASPRPKGDPRFYGGDVPRLMVEDVTRDGKYVTPRVDFLTKEGAKRSRPCEKGTLTIVCSGTVGVTSFLAVDACIHDGFLALVNLKNRVYDDYLYHLLESERLRFDSSATHGGVFTNLTTSILRRFKILLPPFPEQRAIAEALSDVDALIERLDALIAKKRAVKAATMQQLLTGQQRLPGFDGAWETRRLGDVMERIVGGGTPSRASSTYWGGQIPWMTVKDFSTFEPSNTQECITEEGLRNSASNLIPSETVITSTRMALGAAAMYDVSVAINQDLKALFTTDDIADYFLLYWFQHNAEQIARLGSGSTVKGLSLSDLKDLDFPKPALKEQQAIATVLSDMDAEIEALEARRNKTKNIKQGMMQELLTGRTRLV